MGLINRIIDNTVEDDNGCWLWQKSLSMSGYGRISINSFDYRVHRISYQEFVGEIPDGLYVLHECDVRSCCNPDHLFVGTQQDNMDDMKDKNRHSVIKGSNHYNAKLTEDNIKIIKTLLLYTDKTQKEIGEIFGVLPNTISRIKTGNRWQHLNR